MGLRLAEGIDAAVLAERFGLPAIVDWPAVDQLTQSGHLTRTGTRIAATPAGRLVLNRLLAEIAA
jgi:oxygen-independent coproporphyrinogen-3 oxidase